MDKLTFKTAKEVAEEYRISEVTQWRLRRSGDLEYYRIAGKILYAPDQLQDLFESRRVGGDKSQMEAVAA